MEGDIRKRCFDPFFTTKEVGKGTGLGLSTTYGIIKSHDGDVAVISSSPKGTTFEIRLPLANGALSNQTIQVVMGAGQSIMIIEKNSNRTTATSDLLDCLGYQIENVISITDAIERYDRINPELVLVDVVDGSKGEMDRLKTLIRNVPYAKIVALIGISMENDRSRRNELADLVKGCIKRPVEIAEFSLLISELIN
jgi:CheY-like chemotaxis protein